MRIVMPHWSATRFMLFEQCPSAFRERYVDGVATAPTEAMLFGSAVHHGLEAHYNGQDGEQAFRAAWKAETQRLAGWGTTVSPLLTGMGLLLIEKVIDLGLRGVPERGFSLDTNLELGAPVIGAIDLYDQANNIVYDFKTTRGGWSQARAQRERWQPLLYTYAVYEEIDEWPAFEYVVMNRLTGALERFRREWTPDEWLDQMNELWLHMVEISIAVAQDRLQCLGTHGRCLECGEKWLHDHVCHVPHSKRITLSKPVLEFVA